MTGDPLDGRESYGARIFGSGHAYSSALVVAVLLVVTAAFGAADPKIPVIDLVQQLVPLVRGRSATLHDVVGQLQYVSQIAGIDHVAIGSGYEGIRPPDGLETAADFPKLSRALLGSGMSRADVEAVFHGNALRLLCPRTAPKP